VGTRYVESNPFPGYYVAVKFEVYFNDTWSAINGGNFYVTNANHSFGVNIGQFGNDSIVLQVGYGGYTVTSGSAYNMDLFGTTGIPISSPVRVKVWKIGKIPT
jgi:hypothetical protein